jgi:hypothetical protein
MSQTVIEAGRVYKVQWENTVLYVRVVGTSRDLPGWWQCESIKSKTLLALPETARWELAGEQSDSH